MLKNKIGHSGVLPGEHLGEQLSPAEWRH